MTKRRTDQARLDRAYQARCSAATGQQVQLHAELMQMLAGLARALEHSNREITTMKRIAARARQAFDRLFALTHTRLSWITG